MSVSVYFLWDLTENTQQPLRQKFQLSIGRYFIKKMSGRLNIHDIIEKPLNLANKVNLEQKQVMFQLVF